MILAGGQGERLSPLTRDRAKPAVPFGEIYRIIDFTLSNCLNSGLRKMHGSAYNKSRSTGRALSLESPCVCAQSGPCRRLRGV